MSLGGRLFALLEIFVSPLTNTLSFLKNSPRILAAKLLEQWDAQTCGKKTPLEDIAASFLQKHSLTTQDTALFYELIFGVLRHLRLIDFELNIRLLQPQKLPAEVYAILRVAAYQILFLTRTPDYAVVNEAVNSIKSSRHSWAKNLCNAVLRRLLREEDQWLSNKQPHSLSELPTVTSHPDWMLRRWHDSLGKDGALERSTWNNTRAPFSLRVNSSRTEVSAAIAWLNENGVKGSPTCYSPVGVEIEGCSGSVSALDWFQKGVFQVQDEASQLVSLLAYKEKQMQGMRVLDACAGLGGKTTHLAELVGDYGHVTAFDVSRQRLKLLDENSRRLGLRNIRVIDELQGLDLAANTQLFDMVLVDAPCSGLGVIRRHPDIKWNRSIKDVLRYASQQQKLLSDFAKYTANGGRLIYAVCTQEPEETVGVVKHFLATHKKWELSRFPGSIRDRLSDCVVEDLDGVHGDFFMPKPALKGMDLFFACCFQCPQK